MNSADYVEFLGETLSPLKHCYFYFSCLLGGVGVKERYNGNDEFIVNRLVSPLLSDSLLPSNSMVSKQKSPQIFMNTFTDVSLTFSVFKVVLCLDISKSAFIVDDSGIRLTSVIAAVEVFLDSLVKKLSLFDWISQVHVSVIGHHAEHNRTFSLWCGCVDKNSKINILIKIIQTRMNIVEDAVEFLGYSESIQNLSQYPSIESYLHAMVGRVNGTHDDMCMSSHHACPVCVLFTSASGTPSVVQFDTALSILCKNRTALHVVVAAAECTNIFDVDSSKSPSLKMLAEVSGGSFECIIPKSSAMSSMSDCHEGWDRFVLFKPIIKHCLLSKDLTNTRRNSRPQLLQSYQLQGATIEHLMSLRFREGFQLVRCTSESCDKYHRSSLLSGTSSPPGLQRGPASHIPSSMSAAPGSNARVLTLQLKKPITRLSWLIYEVTFQCRNPSWIPASKKSGKASSRDNFAFVGYLPSSASLAATANGKSQSLYRSGLPLSLWTTGTFSVEVSCARPSVGYTGQGTPLAPPSEHSSESEVSFASTTKLIASLVSGMMECDKVVATLCGSPGMPGYCASSDDTEYMACTVPPVLTRANSRRGPLTFSTNVKAGPINRDAISPPADLSPPPLLHSHCPPVPAGMVSTRTLSASSDLCELLCSLDDAYHCYMLIHPRVDRGIDIAAKGKESEHDGEKKVNNSPTYFDVLQLATHSGKGENSVAAVIVSNILSQLGESSECHLLTSLKWLFVHRIPFPHSQMNSFGSHSHSPVSAPSSWFSVAFIVELQQNVPLFFNVKISSISSHFIGTPLKASSDKSKSLGNVFPKTNRPWEAIVMTEISNCIRNENFPLTFLKRNLCPFVLCFLQSVTTPSPSFESRGKKALRSSQTNVNSDLPLAASGSVLSNVEMLSPMLFYLDCCSTCHTYTFSNASSSAKLIYSHLLTDLRLSKVNSSFDIIKETDLSSVGRTDVILGFVISREVQLSGSVTSGESILFCRVHDVLDRPSHTRSNAQSKASCTVTIHVDYYFEVDSNELSLDTLLWSDVDRSHSTRLCDIISNIKRKDKETFMLYQSLLGTSL